MKQIEVHFQETFTGERIDVLAAGQVKARVVATTRFQTGLAHIERLDLDDGEEVTLRIDELDLEATFNVDVTRPFVAVTKINGQLRVESMATSPGYL